MTSPRETQRDTSPGVYFNSPNTSAAGMSGRLLSDVSIRETQTYKDKLSRYLNTRIPTKPLAEVATLSSLTKHGSPPPTSKQQNVKEQTYDRSDRKLRIEIKSRDANRGGEDRGQADKEKKAPVEDKPKIRAEERKPTTLKGIEPSPSLRSHLQLLRAKSDTDNDMRSKSPRMNTPEKKVREESTRPSRPPITYTIKWMASHWSKVEEQLRVDKILGQGSFAKVYQGFDLVSKSIVAIKILDKRKISELGFQKMAEKEVEIVQSINHPHICKFDKMLEDKNRVASA